jgi:hypothetical protein
MTGAFITSIGLVLDIIGAFFIWYFVIEVSLLDMAEFLKGRAAVALSDPSPGAIGAYKKRISMSRIGVGLLIVGFILQLVGNLMH